DGGAATSRAFADASRPSSCRGSDAAIIATGRPEPASSAPSCIVRWSVNVTTPAPIPTAAAASPFPRREWLIAACAGSLDRKAIEVTGALDSRQTPHGKASASRLAGTSGAGRDAAEGGPLVRLESGKRERCGACA